MTHENESIVRWQKYSIDQLGFTSNLIFTITIAIIGYLISYIIDDKFLITHDCKALFNIGLFLLILCFILGISFNITRLSDFRITAKITRNENKSGDSIKLKKLRSTGRCLGKTTWILFYIQIGSFTLGLIFILISFLMMFSEKLF